MKTSDCRLIVFAKAPVPGRVKTRLIPSIGPLAAAALYEQLVLQCLSIAIHARLGPVELWCTPSVHHPFFLQCAREFPVALFHQAEGDLGHRMVHAFQKSLKKVPYVLLMGADCPSLTSDDLGEAAGVLRQGMDAVIGPASDGGYVLIGLCRCTPELFSGISWGTGSVLQETRERLRDLGWKWHELSERWDVDRPEDVERLKQEGYLDAALKKWILPLFSTILAL